MNQRPFISSNLNIYDETRCVFSSGVIGGQPVLISQEQNRKTCDTIMTSITSNQPRIGNCCCPIQQQTAAPNQSWACPLQAQKQGTPQGVIFNFPQPNCSIPPTCIPSTYTPPPPPAPQIVQCPYKTPQSVCTDFQRYGLEAMMFQDKLKAQCSFFTYDKKVGTSDDFLYPKSNLCCCGTQSTSLTADQTVEVTNRVDETDCKTKLKVFSWENKAKSKEECFCFPNFDADELRCAQRKRKEEIRRNFDCMNPMDQCLNFEENICNNYDVSQETESCRPKPTCLKKYDHLPKDKKCVSFKLCDKTLSISEQKTDQQNKGCSIVGGAVTRQTEESQKSEIQKPLIYKSFNISHEDSNEELNKDKYQCDIIRQITHLKRKRKSLMRMYSFFNDNLTDSLSKIDNEIDNLRNLCHGKSKKKTNTIYPRFSGIINLAEDFEDSDDILISPNNETLEARNVISNKTEDMSVPTEILNSSEDSRKEKNSTYSTQDTKDLGIENVFVENEEEKMFPKMDNNNTNKIIKTEESIETKNLLDQVAKRLAASSDNIAVANSNQNQTSAEETKHEDNDIRDTGSEKEKSVKIAVEDYRQVPNDSIDEFFQLRRNAISFTASDDLPEEFAAFARRKTVSSPIRCKRGLETCVPNCRRKKIVKETKEVSPLTDSDVTKTQTADVKSQVDEAKNATGVSVALHNVSETKLQPNNDNEDSFNYQNKDSEAPSTVVMAKPISDDDRNENRTDYEVDDENNQPETSKTNQNNIVVEAKKELPEGKHIESDEASCSTLCDPKVHHEGIDGNFCQKTEQMEVQPFQSCTCETIERLRNIWQFMDTQEPQACILRQPNEIRERQNECQPVLRNRMPRISPDRFGTNRYCGRTCYDVETNQWYSCCSRIEEHVVQITFRETAEQRTVLLTDGCRNSRFIVIYE